MLAPVDNEAVVLTVLSDRFRLPLERLAPGKVLVTEAVHPSMTARAFVRHGGAVVGVAPEQAARLRDLLDGHDTVEPALKALAAELPGHMFSGTARTGVVIPPPAVEVTVLDASDPRLPEWVHGHFTGEAWVVMEDGEVLSTAVLKRYDERLREISVGTAPSARGRGLARSVVAAAAAAPPPAPRRPRPAARGGRAGRARPRPPPPPRPRARRGCARWQQFSC